jgi:hypothetical protein
MAGGATAGGAGSGGTGLRGTAGRDGRQRGRGRQRENTGRARTAASSAGGAGPPAGGAEPHRGPGAAAAAGRHRPPCRAARMSHAAREPPWHPNHLACGPAAIAAPAPRRAAPATGGRRATVVAGNCRHSEQCGCAAAGPLRQITRGGSRGTPAETLAFAWHPTVRTEPVRMTASRRPPAVRRARAASAPASAAAGDHAREARALLEALQAVARELRLTERRGRARSACRRRSCARCASSPRAPRVAGRSRRAHLHRPSSASVVVQRLVERGLVMRADSEQDRRRTELRATRRAAPWSRARRPTPSAASADALSRSAAARRPRCRAACRPSPAASAPRRTAPRRRAVARPRARRARPAARPPRAA